MIRVSSRLEKAVISSSLVGAGEVAKSINYNIYQRNIDKKKDLKD
jgi:hypothetical protein